MAEQAQGKRPIFSVSNKHAAGSGSPPHIDGDTRGRYHMNPYPKHINRQHVGSYVPWPGYG